MEGQRVLLLLDAQGYKNAVSAVKKFVMGNSASHVNVLRGELLVPIKKPDYCNFQLYRDPNICLFCDANDVAPLIHTEFLLMEAIGKPIDRIRAFETKLDWGVCLKEGSSVKLAFPGGNNYSVAEWVRATVCYKGPVGNTPGTIFGVEILEDRYRNGKYGTSDGTFQNHRYFNCLDGCGLFVSLNWLSETSGTDREVRTRAAGREVNKSSTVIKNDGVHSVPRNKSEESRGAELARGDPKRLGADVHGNPTPHSKPGESRNMEPGRREASYSSAVKKDIPSQNTRSKAHESSVDALPPLYQVGQRVTFFDNVGNKHHGVVRWTGRSSLTREFPYTIVGIIPDDDIYKTDFESSVPGMDLYLPSAPKRRALFLPESLVDASVKVPARPEKPQEFCVDVTPKLLKEQEQVLERAGKTKTAKEDQEAIHAMKAAEESINITEQQEMYKRLQEENRVKEHSNAEVGGPQDGQARRQSSNHVYEDMEHSPSSQRLRMKNAGEHNISPVSQHRDMPQQQHHHGHNPSQYDQQTYPASSRIADHNADSGYQMDQDKQFHDPRTHYEDHERQRQDHERPHQDHERQHQDHERQHQDQEQPHQDQRGAASNEIFASIGVAGSREEVFHNVGVGSLIEIPSYDPSNPLRYGTIRWIGSIPNVQGEISGIELDAQMDGCTDGTFPQTGQRFFDCPSGRGLYYPLRNLRADQRYAPEIAADGNPLGGVSEEEPADATDTPSIDMYIGNERGIQGHQNSCYLDATLFGLFALSMEFDAMFLQKTPANSVTTSTISTILWKNIVNPLRKNGVVKFESVMKLREQLEQLGKMKGITQDEKDPEEFLNMMFKHTLEVQPFISIRRPFGVEKEFFVQLFLEMDGSLKSPSVGELLHKMFQEQDITFTEVPQKLLIQVPRFGKKFQTFQKIIPTKSINVADIVDLAHPLEKCFVCGEIAKQTCPECSRVYAKEDSDVICGVCSGRFHMRKERKTHKLEWCEEIRSLRLIADLELLSVICIETSHYVCFTRKGDRWIFFDSMANRVYDKYNIPKVNDCTDVLNQWVYPKNGDLSRLLNTPPRDLPEYVRRFTQDIYMCVYIQEDMAMYT